MDCISYTMDNGFTVFGLDKRTRSILLFLTKGNMEDCAIFLKVLGKCRSEKIAVNKFRLHKIRQANVSFEEIEGIHNEDEIKALEKLFMHPITEHEKELLTYQKNNGSITLDKLFHCHKREPRAMLLRFLL